MDISRIMNALNGLDTHMFLAGDGFVDEVWDIVSQRKDFGNYTPFREMRVYGERILASGKGGLGLEIVKKRRSFGGFTANIGYAAAMLGVKTTLAGVYGKNGIDPIFEDVNKACRVYSLADPAITHAFEFDDGKILMSDLSPVLDTCWNDIVDKLGIAAVKALVAESSVMGAGYWSLLPAFDEIVSGIAELVPNDGKPRRFFFDFADFRKRDNAALTNTLDSLKALNERIPVTLSVNEHEGAALFGLYNIPFDEAERSFEDRINTVRENIGFDELVVHTPQFAAAASSNEEPAALNQIYCEKPVRSAGAGDTFNGGYIAAKLAGLNTKERLYTANAAVGFFLNNACAPNREQLAIEMERRGRGN